MGEWIKCEDRLPDSYNGIAEWSSEMCVLVRHSNYASDCEPYYEVRIAMYHTRIQQWFQDSEVIGVYRTEAVVAWMELPKPPDGCRTLQEQELLGSSPETVKASNT